MANESDLFFEANPSTTKTIKTSKPSPTDEFDVFRQFSSPPIPIPTQTSKDLLSTEFSRNRKTPPSVPHKGSLCRRPSTTPQYSYEYVIEIAVDHADFHELCYDHQDYEFMSRLFAIMDTESRGTVSREAVQRFVTVRCPVFWRRDQDLRQLDASFSPSDSPTFDEVWAAVTDCSRNRNRTTPTTTCAVLGVEGWMVFCRFIALAQYLEAKRRFSARHLQQTMRHRNSPRGSELVVVDVPPPVSPTQLTPLKLAQHERKSKQPLPRPELDLDHSLIAAHDVVVRRQHQHQQLQVLYPKGFVKISLFGPGHNGTNGGNSSLNSRTTSKQTGSSSSSSSDIDFALTFANKDSGGADAEEVVVRRSFGDTKWLHETFKSHKGLGGTLCGRILPPFPEPPSTATIAVDERTIQRSIDGTGAAVKAATAGVGMIKNVAKSFWGNYVDSSSIGTSSGTSSGASAVPTSKAPEAEKKPEPKRVHHRHLTVSESYYNPNSPNSKARQIERYLNYLLEHPALSTSFPLNTILTASQSGLEAARLILEDQAKATKQIKEQTPKDPSASKGGLSYWTNQALPAAYSAKLPWVKTAAQAAVALRVHGLLETTGLPSASARLQHASLPNFSSRNSRWVDEEGARRATESPQTVDGVEGGVESFEHGVIEVESRLGEGFASPDEHGYDLLPLPVPAPERRILCAGSSSHNTQQRHASDAANSRFRYGGSQESERLHSLENYAVESAFLGEFSVDDNIDKLREVIGSVDSTLSRCVGAIARIGETRRALMGCHIQVVRGFDSWEGLRGKFVSQRALLRGVAGLEQGKDVSEESDYEMTDDMSWQASLASSAVSAAEDVRSTVRAARVAANAKAAADSAALAAQSACDGTRFNTIDEARAAQTRASIAQSHAIHAAVVEHEATTAKRSGALALAHDVKSWNIHRKRELWKSCLTYARSQHRATRRAVDAWSCLRDGYLGSTLVPYSDERSQPLTSRSTPLATEERIFIRPVKPEVVQEYKHEASSQIYSEVSPGMESAMGAPTINVVDHLVLSAPPSEEQSPPQESDMTMMAAAMETTTTTTAVENEPDDIFQTLPSKILTAIEEEDYSRPPLVEAAPAPESPKPFGADSKVFDSKVFAGEPENPLSASMQSLVDGLMTWGSQYDSQEDMALPSGMAASIVLEGNDVN